MHRGGGPKGGVDSCGKFGSGKLHKTKKGDLNCSLDIIQVQEVAQLIVPWFSPCPIQSRVANEIHFFKIACLCQTRGGTLAIFMSYCMNCGQWHSWGYLG